MISAETLAQRLPVHAIIGPDLRVLQIGSALARVCGDVVGRSFDACFELVRPTLSVLDAPALRALGPVFCQINCRANGLALRAEFLPGDAGCVVMMGSPAVLSLDELRQYGLGLNDFAVTDPSVEFFMALTTQRATLDELHAVNARQREQRKELERINARLEAATREANHASAVKSRFLSKMSHELRTPLNAITGLTQLLRDSARDAEQREYFDDLRDASRLLLSLIGQVLDLSKIESGQMTLERQPFDLHDTIQKVMHPLRARAQLRGLACTWSLDAPPGVWLWGDALRLQQIALNLVGNALKFTQRGEVEVRVVLSQGRLRLAVRDTGPGIAAEDLAQLFQPFVQVGPAQLQEEGSGLGLALSRELAALMGGTLSAQSEPGVGSVFVLDVPAEEGQAIAPKSTLRVLLVDDNAINRMVGQRLLQREGHQVEVLESGEQAIERLARETYDAVFMDVQMPGLDGLETTRILRGKGLRTPVVALTANALSGDREVCIAAGMTDYLPKPLDLGELRAVVQRIAGQ
jgi:signal transduction histidine kinase/CheY-like chemotaxis protein